MGHFKVIFFNVGGTLIQLKGTTLPILYSQHLTNILQKHISPQEVYKAFQAADTWTLSRKNPGSLFSDLDQRKYQNIFYNQLGIRNRKEINRIENLLANQLSFDYVLERSVIKLLNSLSEYHLGIISNWDESLVDILQELGIIEYFDSITLSREIGIGKPSYEIFKSALADFQGIKPKETVFLSSWYFRDILPAQKLNFFVILYDKGPNGMHGRPFHSDIKSPRIKELNELPPVVQKYSRIKNQDKQR
ncbi:MAG: HAD family hydrolase [Candidatus Hermodarchaeota archaeon]